MVFLTASVGSNVTSGRTLTKDPTYTARLELDPKIGKVNLLFGGSYASADLVQSTPNGPSAMSSYFYGFFTRDWI